MKSHPSYPEVVYILWRSAQERLNKFPLSCVCYSRAENGRSSGAGGQGQSGAAATRRAEGAR